MTKHITFLQYMFALLFFFFAICEVHALQLTVSQTTFAPGDTLTVTWTENSFLDPNQFTLELVDDTTTRAVQGATFDVDTAGQQTGTTTPFSVASIPPGDYHISAVSQTIRFPLASTLAFTILPNIGQTSASQSAQPVSPTTGDSSTAPGTTDSTATPTQTNTNTADPVNTNTGLTTTSTTTDAVFTSPASVTNTGASDQSTNSSAPVGSTSKKTPIIVGTLCAVVVGLGILALVILTIMRRYNKKREEKDILVFNQDRMVRNLNTPPPGAANNFAPQFATGSYAEYSPATEYPEKQPLPSYGYTPAAWPREEKGQWNGMQGP